MPSLQAVAVGFGLGLALGLPPGPVLARIAHEASSGRALQGGLVGLGATSADALFFAAAAWGVLAARPPAPVFAALAFLGVVVLLVFARDAWMAARRTELPPPARRSGYWGGFALAGTSPFNWAFWATTGVSYLADWGPALALGFFPALFLVIALSVGLFASLGRISSRVPHIVAYVSAALLALFAFVLAYRTIEEIWSPS